MGILHANSNLPNKRKDDKRRNSVRDESRNDQYQGRKDNQDAVETEVLDPLRDGVCNGVKKSGGCDRFAKAETTGREDDDGPQKVVEVFLCQNACSKEEYERYNCNYTHVAKGIFKLVTGAP